jgi:hypothetical protein
MSLAVDCFAAVGFHDDPLAGDDETDETETAVLPLEVLSTLKVLPEKLFGCRVSEVVVVGRNETDLYVFEDVLPADKLALSPKGDHALALTSSPACDFIFIITSQAVGWV